MPSARHYERSHHATLHDIAPWNRREVARNTGHKCERSEMPRAMREAQRREARTAGKRETMREVREALSAR